MIILKKIFLPLLYCLCTGILFFSCQKNIDDINIDPGQTPDFTTQVSSAVSGFVTDENNAPVIGASVTAGSSHATTNKFGFFEFKNIMVVKDAAVVIVEKSGYFKGIKTYIARQGKAAAFRIKLLPKTNAGTIDASSGGSITLSNGAKVSLPANAVMNAGSNVAYTGTVNLAVRWIDPTATDGAETTPGDNRSLTTTNSLKLGKSYGMLAVELTGTSGELLQIAAGKKATINTPIPSSLTATAPATLTIGSMDETTGLWKDEGIATKSGNIYSAEVSHFSFWDNYLPSEYVQFSGTVKDAAGQPIAFTFVYIVDISPNSGTYGAAWGETDGSGYVSGAIPANSTLDLVVYSPYCQSPNPFEQSFTTTNLNVDYGDIVLNQAAPVYNVTGTVNNCSNTAVTNGVLYVQKYGTCYAYPLSSTGSFSFSMLGFCSQPTSLVILTAEDFSTSYQSIPLTYTLHPGQNNIGNLNACNNTAQEYFTYSIDGNTTSWTSPTTSFSDINWTTTRQLWTWAPTGSTILTYSNQNIGLNSIQELIGFRCPQVSDSLTTNTVVPVHITEFGNVGEYLSGNFSGTMVGYQSPGTTYNVTCNFRVKRSN